MKIVYIANLKSHSRGGLFKATFERLRRMEKRLDKSYVINNNFYDSLAVRLLKRLFRVNVDETKKPEQERYKDITIHHSNYKRTLFFYIKRLLHLESTENGLISHYLKNYKHQLEEADIIHAQWGWTDGYVAYKISQKLDKPYIITLHGSDINKVWKHNEARLIEAMEHAEICFFVSNQLIAEAKARGYSGKNARVSYNGVDTSLYQKQNKNKSNHVGYIGSLKKIKGADLLPNIFSRIAENNTKAKFTIVGDGELSESLKHTFSEMEIACAMLGSVDYDEVPSILKSFDVLVAPSRNEGLGMIILEANAMGIPVVGTNVGGIPEAIGFQDNIIDFDSHVAAHIADRVNELLRSEIDSNKYRQRIVNTFNWDHIVSHEIAEYQLILKSKK